MFVLFCIPKWEKQNRFEWGKIRNKINHGVIFPIFCSSYPQIHPDFIQFVFFRDGVIYPISIHIPSSCLPVQHQSRWWLPASDLALWRGITDRDAGGFVEETDEKPSQESGWKRRRHLCSVGTEWNGKKPVTSQFGDTSIPVSWRMWGLAYSGLRNIPLCHTSLVQAVSSRVICRWISTLYGWNQQLASSSQHVPPAPSLCILWISWCCRTPAHLK